MRSLWSEAPVNIRSETETTIAEVATVVMQRLAAQDAGQTSRIVYEDAVRDDPQRRNPDCSLARRVLSWEPGVSLEDGIYRTIAWFVAVADKSGRNP